MKAYPEVTVIPSGQPLPAPRLQLRWVQNDPINQYQWLCHYELVLPLQEYDIRREVYDEDGVMVSKIDELAVPIKDPTRRNSSSNRQPCQSDVGYYFDDPIRDGVHAKWDAAVLGNPPIFCIHPDGTAIKQPEQQST